MAAKVSAAMSGETLQERSKGKDVRQSNIVAAKAVANAIRTSLGPRGMDKLMQMSSSGEVLISNDGATILSKMNVLHPAAKMLVELSKSQDVEAGDGTTSVVVIAGALLEVSGELLHKGIHPTAIASSFLRAAEKATKFLQAMAKPVNLSDRANLIAAVNTCLASKVVAQNADILAPLAVDSVLGILEDPDTATNVDLRDIRMVLQKGGTVDDTELVRGLVFDKGSTKSAGGPSQMENAKIALIQFCLSAPKTDMDNSVVVSDYAAMDRILREERKYILGLCKKIKKAGATVVLIQKSILRDAYNELSLHFLAKMGILVVTDVERTDVDFICRTLGCTPVAHADAMTEDKLGFAEQVREVAMPGSGNNNKVVKFTGVKNPGKTTTVLLRGSNDLVLAEANRSIHDAQCVVRSLVKKRFLIAGGGAPETEVALRLKEYALGTAGMDSYCIKAFADALEVIPYTLAENAGMKPIEMVTELRKQHAEGVSGAGINIKKNCVSDMYDLEVLQPLLVSTSAIQLATETVCMILKVDDLIVVA